MMLVKFLYRFLPVIYSCLLCFTVHGQPSGFARHLVPIRDSSEMYVNDGTSDTLFYLAGAPDGVIKGALVLFPATGEPVESLVSINSRLCDIARDSGFLVIVPSINHNLCMDRTSLDFVNAVVKQALSRYKPPRSNFVLGGFSLGGTNAVCYAELAVKGSVGAEIRPAAVYGVDPPLDWARMYYSFSRAIQKNFSEVAVNEASYYVRRLNLTFGGNPQEQPATYQRFSAYSKGVEGGGNTRYLVHVPVRIYSDPDIEWQLANRRVDFYDMNVLDGSAMINQLHLDGNGKAELVVALGKGYRPDGSRHPHSWSLVEPVECVRWMMQCLAYH